MRIISWSLGTIVPCLLSSTVDALPTTTASNNSTNNSTSWVVGSVVKTTSGQIAGHAAPKAPGVSEYLGIPFAQPPIGTLRFAAPQAFNGSALINQTSFALNCPQPTVGLPGLTEAPSAQFIQFMLAIGNGPDSATNEDCLYLNVWTKPQTGDKKKAVMIWFYPGGFRSGGTNNQGISGQYYADQHDVIVVTFNYRVSALGFPGAPGLDQNLGFLDQRLAVEWVRDNIAAFGGDVDRIILFGESAGAAGIDYYNYAYLDDPIIAGSIMESGSTVLGGAISNATATTLWNRLVVAANCEVGTSAQILACMRAIPADQFITYTTAVSGGGYAFNPMVDDKIVFQDYTARQSEGAFIKKPILIGNNDYEAAWFKLTQGLIHPESWYVGTNLAVFTCVSENLAALRRQFSISSWRYRFYPTFPNTVHPYNSSIAMHTSEVPLVWGTYDDAITAASGTNEERSLSDLIMNYWSTFAKNPSSGLSDAGWPVYDDSSDTLALFGYNNQSANASFVNPSLTDSQCGAKVKAYCS